MTVCVDLFLAGIPCSTCLQIRTVSIKLYTAQPRSQGLLEEGKRPWHRLASSAISLVYYFTQLIYSKPDIRIFAWRKKLRVKLPTFNDLLSRCVTCRIFLKKIFRICSCRANLFKHHDFWF